MSDSAEPLLRVQNLQKHYPITEGVLKREIGRVRAVDGIDFEVDRGETFGLVGESGCGKSTAATSLLRLEQPTGGSVYFDGEDITEYNRVELKRFRRRAQMIFQDPNSSFDPRMSVGESVAEPLVVHGMRDRSRRREIVSNLLVRVGLQAADIDRYPHEFSGGQKQRIGLARALVLNPDLLVADEPVSALDVSIQAEILAIMKDLQEEFGLGILIISHNLGVIQQICDRVGVMYLGEIVEQGPTEELFENPKHPYTQALISSIPDPNPRRRQQGIRLTGDVPSPSNPPAGCRFHTRCPKVIPPTDYEFEQEHWRAVMDFTQRVHGGDLDVDGAREFVLTETDQYATLEEVPHAEISRQIRSTFDIPGELTDARAESVLSEAIDLVIDESPEAASALLEEEFDTVCRQETPETAEIDPGHTAACHLNELDTGSSPVTVESAED